METFEIEENDRNWIEVTIIEIEFLFKGGVQIESGRN